MTIYRSIGAAESDTYDTVNDANRVRKNAYTDGNTDTNRKNCQKNWRKNEPGTLTEETIIQYMSEKWAEEEKIHAFAVSQDRRCRLRSSEMI